MRNRGWTTERETWQNSIQSYQTTTNVDQIISMFHLCTNAGPWMGCVRLCAIDEHLEKHGSTPVTLRWESYALQQDGLHFTQCGQKDFSLELVNALLSALKQGDSLLIVSDSTIGHNGDRVSVDFLTNEFEKHGLHVTIDNVCGSGFASGSRENQHFRARISRRARKCELYDALLFIGGWNDSSHALSTLALCVPSAVKCAYGVIRDCSDTHHT